MSKAPPPLEGKGPPVYYLDPNFSRAPPKDGRFCCRCHRRLKDTEGLGVTVDSSGFRITFGGPDRIHRDCWETVKRNDWPEDVPIAKRRGRPRRAQGLSEIFSVRIHKTAAAALRREFGSLGNALYYLYTGIQTYKTKKAKENETNI